MVKGGYQIINLDGVVHTLGIGEQHENLYGRIEGTHKPILLSGLNVGGFDYHDVYVTPKVVGSNYVVEAYDFDITITDSDMVTINKKESFAIETYALDTHFVTGSNTVPAADYEKLHSIISGSKFAKLIFYYDERIKDEYTVGFDVNDRSLYTANYSFRIENETTIYVNNV